MKFRRMMVLVLLAGNAACELGEINVPSTEPIVVVQSVMRPDRLHQWILVEQTLTGRLAGQGSVDIVPSGEPLQAAIVNARVFVSNVNLPNDLCGPTTAFVQTPPPGEPDQAGVYWSPAGCPTMRAGDTLELHVEALDSVVTGRTEIPGFRAATLRAGVNSITAPFAQLEFNRDTDTLDTSVDATHGRAIHVELHRSVIDGLDPFQTTQDNGSWFWVDSTGLTLPGDFLNFFEGEDFESDGGSVPDLFVAGFEYEVTTSFMDKNLFDSFRSANFPLSGRGYVSNLAGGYGLFGSLVAQANTLRVTGDVDDPREGLFEISGLVDGQSINLEIELYVGRQWRPSYPATPVAAFADGVWVDGQYHGSISGSLLPNGQVSMVVPPLSESDQTPATVYVLEGTWPQGTTGSLDVFLSNLDSGLVTPAGTASVRRR